ncbi:MAG TPA: hypothetical protein VLW65_12860 [Bryobacteraceae bacterium]|nr:hypothetical protein [Bryobacteraceae bacterium]
MPLAGATFGNVVTTVGGHPADIALDQSRGQLYIANFTALEIDVMSTKDNAIHSSIPLPSHPSGVALSADSTYLVVTEYQNGTSTPQGFNGVTIINLATNATQNFSTGDPALGVAFVRTGQARGMNSGQALVATTTGFYLLDPASGYMQFLVTFGTLVTQSIPISQGSFPGQIVQTQLTASANGLWIWGVADAGTGTQLLFSFDATYVRFNAQVWITSPPLLPRVSVAADGSWALIGWAQYAPAQCGGGFMIQSRYPQAVASTSVTGHAANSNNGVTDTIYAQIFDANQPSGPPYTPTSPAASASPAKLPALSIMDADNLTVRDKIYLPENLQGRALVDSAGNYMYAISDSGVSVLPVGLLNKYPRLQTSQSNLLVQTNFCNRNPLTATFQVTDPGNNATDFQIISSQTGVLVSPSSGRTPATITVTVQPGAIPNPGGTLAVPLTVYSTTAVNASPTVTVLINNPDPDQRGTIVNIPGKLVDLVSDAARNRFYVLRQDQNQVLVFDGTSYQQLTTLRTGTTPTGMSLTNDGKYLLIASRDSQLVRMFDLDSFQQQIPIELPASHYGSAVAQSNVGTFALVENDGTGDCASDAACAIDRLDLVSRCAFSPPTLGIFKNDNTVLNAQSVLSPSPDQNTILVAAPNGNVMLYDATHDTFLISRKDLTTLSGAYAVSAGASASGSANSARFVIGNNVFDSSLVPQGTLDTSVGTTAGFAFTGAGGYRVTGSTASAPGVIENVPNVMAPGTVKAVRTVEAPDLSSTNQPFTRTVAPLANGIILLTTSGVTVLAPNYDASVAAPMISGVASAADGSQNVAPGGLISIYGQQMSPMNMATSQIPLPTALAGSCLAVNGVPVPLLFVSSQQVNAQLPYNVGGSASLTIYTPGGISPSYSFNISPAAPTVFMSGSAGPMTGLATIVRADNGQLVTPTNPIHAKDTIVIYLTGMGATYPQVVAGLAAPLSPLATVISSPDLSLGGFPLQVQYAGLVPGEVGVYQINAYVPFGVPQGTSLPLVINQGGSSTTLNVRVVD